MTAIAGDRHRRAARHDAGPEDGVDQVGRVVAAHLDAVPDEHPQADEHRHRDEFGHGCSRRTSHLPGLDGEIDAHASLPMPT